MQKFLSHKWLILSLILAVWAGRMLLTSSHFYTHDDIQVFRLNEFVECIGRGEIPCRWSTAMGKGYGYPLFNYYPPMIYVVPALIHLLGFSLITSLNLFMFLTFLLAAAGMYYLARLLTQRDDLGFLASALYTLYPWHATNVFIRGVYGENLAWSLAPWLLWLIYRQVKTGRFQFALPLVLAVLFLTHIISSFILVGIAVVWIGLLGFKQWKTFLVQFFVGIGLSAFFFIPAIFEKGLVQSDTLTQGYYAYTNHFVGLKQLFIDYTWVYGASYWGTPPEEMGFMVGHVHIILLLVSLGLCLVYVRKRSTLTLAGGLLGLSAVLLFMTHSKSVALWSLVPSLSFIQFPWRLIGWAGLPLILSLVLLISTIPRKLSYVIALVSLVCLVIYSSPFFRPRGYDSYNDSDFTAGELTANQQVSSIYDYLPTTVKVIPEVYAQDSDYPLPVFYFPGWTARVGGEPVEIVPTDPHGFIAPKSSSIPVESLELTWRETPFRLVMDILSLVTLVGYLVYYRRTHVQ